MIHIYIKYIINISLFKSIWLQGFGFSYETVKQISFICEWIHLWMNSFVLFISEWNGFIMISYEFHRDINETEFHLCFRVLEFHLSLINDKCFIYKCFCFIYKWNRVSQIFDVNCILVYTSILTFWFLRHCIKLIDLQAYRPFLL